MSNVTSNESARRQGAPLEMAQVFAIGTGILYLMGETFHSSQLRTLGFPFALDRRPFSEAVASGFMCLIFSPFHVPLLTISAYISMFGPLYLLHQRGKLKRPFSHVVWIYLAVMFAITQGTVAFTAGSKNGKRALAEMDGFLEGKTKARPFTTIKVTITDQAKTETLEGFSFVNKDYVAVYNQTGMIAIPERLVKRIEVTARPAD